MLINQTFSYIFVVVIPYWLVIGGSFLLFQCFWCHFSGSIVQLAVFCCVDLVEVERETLTIRHAVVGTLLPPHETESLKDITNKSNVLFRIGSKRKRYLFAQSICTVTARGVNGKHHYKDQLYKLAIIIHCSFLCYLLAPPRAYRPRFLWRVQSEVRWKQNRQLKCFGTAISCLYIMVIIIFGIALSLLVAYLLLIPFNDVQIYVSPHSWTGAGPTMVNMIWEIIATVFPRKWCLYLTNNFSVICGKKFIKNWENRTWNFSTTTKNYKKWEKLTKVFF